MTSRDRFEKAAADLNTRLELLERLERLAAQHNGDERLPVRLLTATNIAMGRIAAAVEEYIKAWDEVPPDMRNT